LAGLIPEAYPKTIEQRELALLPDTDSQVLTT